MNRTSSPSSKPLRPWAPCCFHPQPHANLLLSRTEKYGLTNSIGVPLEDTLVLATLIFGGILDACPDLKVCIAHGGGPACFGMGRLDRGWQVRSEARTHIHKPRAPTSVVCTTTA